MFGAPNVHYEVAERTRGFGVGGLGAMHQMAQSTGLVEEIDRRLPLLKVHLPYHESDHVLNLAYNVLAGGRCLEDLELLRNDEVYLDALGAQRIPDPTTAGDFCRRFQWYHVEWLMQAINEARLRVWRQQPETFFEEAVIEADGTLVETTGECKQGMDLSYQGVWGAGRGSGGSRCAGIRTSARRSTWIAGTRRAFASCSGSTPCRTW
jgi:hypothetical protein